MREIVVTLALLTAASAVAQDQPAPSPTAPSQELTAERLRTLRAYRSQRLEIRSVTEMTGGGTSMTPGWGVGGVQIYSEPIRTVHSWAVFRGPAQVQLPEYYELLGDVERAQSLRRRIRRNRTAAASLYALSGAGAVSAVVGFVGLNAPGTGIDNRTYSWMITGGLVGMLVGSLGGGIPASRASTLQSDHTKVLDPHEAQFEIDAYNERLRRDLGVTPEDAARVELGAP